MASVLIVVDDLEAAIAFFAALGPEAGGKATVEGRSVDRLVGFDGVRSDIVMMRTPQAAMGALSSTSSTPPAMRADVTKLCRIADSRWEAAMTYRAANGC